ncbi:MAG: hemerythrin domain-containing protein [Nitrosopumilus sp.]|nr:hemerythrin domain-containing protein [Nitrosopumilus sp.]MDA7942514.1 hemerythrin domain-containing protein [Nitrosopumilus sp.]MDA7952607.1 hemerythrin domain-containing protein [Nitrosopumilus sp.]MDA7958180.1 hemerythrin domain-containing protein [Nitrosopumilus sp.]
MSATGVLREDHEEIRRFGGVVARCHSALLAGADVPLPDLRRIAAVIDEFLDSVHYSREEDSYFPCVASYGLRKEVHDLLVEHEFSRRIAARLRRYLDGWEAGADGREPVARHLRTYCIYLEDHLRKEDDLFERAGAGILSPEEESEMYRQFTEDVAAARIRDMKAEVAYLAGRPWAA